jgi:hypothetical protein
MVTSHVGNKHFTIVTYWCNWVLNEADTFKTSSFLIYLHRAQSIYTSNKWQDAIIIKKRNYRQN